jgi:hypothetical protein
LAELAPQVWWLTAYAVTPFLSNSIQNMPRWPRSESWTTAECSQTSVTTENGREQDMGRDDDLEEVRRTMEGLRDKELAKLAQLNFEIAEINKQINDIGRMLEIMRKYGKD